MPVILLRSTEDVQILLKGLIGPFASSIRLRVICRADILMNVEKATKFRGKFGCETDILVRNDFAGDTVVWNHVGCVEQCYSFRVDAFRAREEYRGFGAICVCDGEDGVVSS